MAGIIRSLRILSQLKELRKRERWTREELLAHQDAALRELRAHAVTRSPFYRELYRGLERAPLGELPVLTKAKLMERFDDVVTDRAVKLDELRRFAQGEREELFRGRYWVTATSGSTGQPGLFIFDESEFVKVIASFARGKEFSGARISLRRRVRHATVASTSPWHGSSQVARAAKSWWTPMIRIAATEPVEEIVRRLNDWRPEVLIAYASMARVLADEQLAGRLRIRPARVYTSSEVLTDETRRRVKEAWGEEPFDQYGATEAAGLAAECAEGRKKHLYEDLVIVEVVDKDYRPVPVGGAGSRVLVTPLFLRTQPLIRYEITDSIGLQPEVCCCGPGACACQHCACMKVEACACGRPFAVLEGVKGRVEDALLLPGVAGGKVPVQPLVFNRVMDVLPVSGWQVVQEANDALTILLSGARELDGGDAALAERVGRSLADVGARVPRIDVRHVEAIPKNASGKAPLVKAWRPPPPV